jgi:hypothetical protein
MNGAIALLTNPPLSASQEEIYVRGKPKTFADQNIKRSPQNPLSGGVPKGRGGSKCIAPNPIAFLNPSVRFVPYNTSTLNPNLSLKSFALIRFALIVVIGPTIFSLPTVISLSF